MERHTSPNEAQDSPRRARAPRGLRRRIARGVAAILLLAGTAGCGGSTADALAVISLPDDADWGTVSESSSYSPIFPIQIQVLRGGSNADTATLPVAGAEITIQVGGINMTGATMDVYHGNTLLANDVQVWVGRTDEYGSVTVDPSGTTVGCGTSTSTLDGSLSVGAWISRDARSWTASFSIDCS